MAIEVSSWTELDGIRSDLSGDYVLTDDLTPEDDDYESVMIIEDREVNHETSDGIAWTKQDVVQLAYKEENYDSILDVKTLGGTSITFSENDDNTITLDENPGDSVLRISYENAVVGFEPLGLSSGMYFDGTLDGQGHVIEGLHINKSGTPPGVEESYTNVGLFYEVNGTVSNIGFEDAYIVGNEGSTDQLGTITGMLDGMSATIQSCYTEGLVQAKYLNTNMGGICGGIYMGTVDNCYSIQTLRNQTSQRVGTLVGQNSDTIQNCYAVPMKATVPESDDLGGLVGHDLANVNSCYWDSSYVLISDGIGHSEGGNTVTELSTADMVGESALTNMSDLNFDSIWKTVSGYYPVLDWLELGPPESVVDQIRNSERRRSEFFMGGASGGGHGDIDGAMYNLFDVLPPLGVPKEANPPVFKSGETRGFITHPSWDCINAGGITIDENDCVWIMDPMTTEMFIRLDQEGTLEYTPSIETGGSPSVDDLRNLGMDKDGSLYSEHHNGISKFDQSGSVLSTPVTCFMSGSLVIDRMDIDEKGSVWVIDADEGKIVESDLSSEGSVISSFSISSTMIPSCHGLSVEDNGNIWIRPKYRNTLLELDRDGSLINQHHNKYIANDVYWIASKDSMMMLSKDETDSIHKMQI